eukprot:scaffold9815_cov90-Amphora_coffeaeformis.AAC.1
MRLAVMRLAVMRLCALWYDGQGRQKDAAGETDVAESCPMLWVDELAEGRGARSVGGFVGVEEVKGTKKSVGWVVEGYMGLFRAERVGDRGSDVAGRFAVRKGRLRIWVQRTVGSREDT